MRTSGLVVAAAAAGLLSAAHADEALSAEVLLFSTSGAGNAFELYEDLPGAGRYRFEATTSAPVTITLEGHYLYHWDVFLAPAPKPHSEYIEGNDRPESFYFDTLGTSAGFDFIVPRTSYTFFENNGFYSVYGIPLGAKMFREDKYERPRFLFYAYDENDQSTEFSYSANVFRVVPEPTSWSLMIIGFCAGGAMLRRERARSHFRARDAR